MEIPRSLRAVFWFLSRQDRATKRWSRERKLPLAEALDRVAAAGSLRAAQASLDREQAEAAALLARQREGLLKNLDGFLRLAEAPIKLDRPPNETASGARLASSR